MKAQENNADIIDAVALAAAEVLAGGFGLAEQAVNNNMDSNVDKNAINAVVSKVCFTYL